MPFISAGHNSGLYSFNSDKQHALSLKNTLLESSLQKARSPIFPCPCSRASGSQVQLHLDNQLLGNSNSPLIRTESKSPGLTSCIYCKFNLENPKPRSQQCFVAPFLWISPMIPFTASDFMLCLSEIQSLNALRTSIFRQVCGALAEYVHCGRYSAQACARVEQHRTRGATLKVGGLTSEAPPAPPPPRALQHRVYSRLCRVSTQIRTRLLY